MCIRDSSSPDPELEIEGNFEFQEYCGRILSNIIEASIADGSMMAWDKENEEVLATKENLEWAKNEYKSRTDDT